jgi:hypothetical protein
MSSLAEGQREEMRNVVQQYLDNDLVPPELIKQLAAGWSFNGYLRDWEVLTWLEKLDQKIEMSKPMKDLIVTVFKEDFDYYPEASGNENTQLPNHPVVATDEPCAGCGREIVPGSLYKPATAHSGPRHFGC